MLLEDLPVSLPFPCMPTHCQGVFEDATHVYVVMEVGAGRGTGAGEGAQEQLEAGECE